ncbi:MAG: EamA family transporter, partial [Pseudomonadota bacterium]
IGAAFTFVCGARVAPKMSPLLMTFWVNAVGLVLILPLIWNQLELPFSLKGNLALAAATIFYLIAILSQFQALARLSAARASFLLNLEPVVSILLAFLVINEILSITQWAGVILVIGVVLLSIKFQPAEA